MGRRKGGERKTLLMLLLPSPPLRLVQFHLRAHFNLIANVEFNFNFNDALNSDPIPRNDRFVFKKIINLMLTADDEDDDSERGTRRAPNLVGNKFLSSP
jgi:hypothetical protein